MFSKKITKTNHLLNFVNNGVKYIRIQQTIQF